MTAGRDAGGGFRWSAIYDAHPVPGSPLLIESAAAVQAWPVGSDSGVDRGAGEFVSKAHRCKRAMSPIAVYANPRNNPRIVYIALPFARKPAADCQPPRVNEAFRSRAASAADPALSQRAYLTTLRPTSAGHRPGSPRSPCMPRGCDQSRSRSGLAAHPGVVDERTVAAAGASARDASRRAEPSRLEGESFTMKQSLHLAAWHRAMNVSADA
jgi:hypothetical protein